MKIQAINTEQKAILKTGIKFLEKVNPNTPYQHKLKSDIKYTINALNVDDIELWIYNNQTSMTQTLRLALSVECLRDSIEEGFTEYTAEKLVEYLMKC